MPRSAPPSLFRRIAGTLLTLLGGLLLVRSGFSLYHFGRLSEPTITSGGLLLASSGIWLLCNTRPPIRTWLPLQVGAVLMVCVWISQWLDLSPRDGLDLLGNAAAAASPGQAQAPALTLPFTELPALSLGKLAHQLQSTGHRVRCYGELQPREQLFPSINQICALNPSQAWGIPSVNISFHYNGEQLELLRAEFPGAQWSAVEQWVAALPGTPAGTFGHDGQGNWIQGKQVSEGLLMTAPPPRNGTVLVLWEAPALAARHCREGRLDGQQQALFCQP